MTAYLGVAAGGLNLTSFTTLHPAMHLVCWQEILLHTSCSTIVCAGADSKYAQVQQVHFFIHPQGAEGRDEEPSWEVQMKLLFMFWLGTGGMTRIGGVSIWGDFVVPSIVCLEAMFSIEDPNVSGSAEPVWACLITVVGFVDLARLRFAIAWLSS